MKNKVALEDCLFFLLVLMMLLAQTGYMGIKLALILIIAIRNFTKRKYKSQNFNGVIYGILSIILLNGFYRLSSAILAGTMSSGDLAKFVPFLLIHPFLFYLLIPNIMGREGEKKTALCLIIGHFFIMTLGFYNLLAVYLGLPPLTLLEDEVYIASEDSISFNASGTYQMFMTLPVFCTLGFSGIINRYVFFIGGFFSAVYVILCGSSAMIGVGLGCFLIPFFLKMKFPHVSGLSINIKKIAVVVIALFVTGFAYLSDKPYVEVAYQEFLDHFDNSTDIRFEQRKVLLEAWKESPIFGHGYGASFVTSARGRDNSFESMYHATLATTGLVGLILFFSYVLLIIVKLYHKARKEGNVYEVAYLIAFIAMLVCSTTNPALASFDRLLIVYICIACLAERKKLIQLH